MVRTYADDIAELIGLKYYPKSLENPFVRLRRVFYCVDRGSSPMGSWRFMVPDGYIGVADAWRVEDKETGISATIHGDMDSIETNARYWRAGLRLGMDKARSQIAEALGLSQGLHFK